MLRHYNQIRRLQAEKNKIISESLTALLSSNLSPEDKGNDVLIDIHNIEPDKANTYSLWTNYEQGLNQED